MWRSGFSCPPAFRRGGAWVVLIAAAVLSGPGGAAAERPPAEALRAVFPDAGRVGVFEREPPAAAAYRDGEVAGYVFRTRAVVQSRGYSGKPLDVLAGVDTQGRITGARILEHHEPILIIGVSEADLQAFADSLAGHDIRRPLEAVARPDPDDPTQVDAVAGATISSSVIGDAVVRGARAVARSRGLLGGRAGRLKLETFAPADWPVLLEDGSLARLRLEVGTVARDLDRLGARLYPEAVPVDPEQTFIELFAGLATPARIGRNLLGEETFSRLSADLSVGDHLLFVAARGLYSYKGAGRAKTGQFRRLQLVQGERTLTFDSAQHTGIDSLAIAGAPDLRQMSVFTIPADSGFDPAATFRLELLVSGTRREGGGEVFTRFVLPYQIPARYLAEAEASAGTPLWQQRWSGQRGRIAVLGGLLLVLTGLLVFQDALVRRPRLFRVVRLAFLAVTLGWIGWYAGAQLSVLNVLTFLEALRTGFEWRTFLLDPLIFILWGYVAISLLFWGRGVFCGWLCPFGALQELIGAGAKAARVPQLRIPFPVSERLWPIKYIVFIGLFAISLGSAGAATRWAEVEPFKTAIVLDFQRDWPYVAYAVAILAVAVFVERPFCRYLCPLGGALAIPARLSMFEWLKRRPQCGRECNICAGFCPVQAIHRDGKINPNECIYCLKCQVIMYDDHVCPPLVRRRKRHEEIQAGRAADRQAQQQQNTAQSEGRT